MRYWLAALVLTVSGTAERTQAQSALGLALVVEAPAAATCITAEALRLGVEARVGAPISSEGRDTRPELHVRVATLATDDHAVVIRLRGADGLQLGERQFRSESSSCEDLERQLLLVISTLLGLEGQALELPVNVVPQAAASQPAQPMPSRAAAEMPVEAEPAGGAPIAPGSPTRDLADSIGTPWARQVTLSVEAHGGWLPRVMPFASMGLGLRHRGLAFRVGAALAPWASRGLGGGAEVHASGWFGLAELCGVADTASLGDLTVCAGARAGAIRVRSEGLGVDSTSTDSAVRLDLRVAWALTISRRHAMLLGMGVGWAARAPRYHVVEANGTPSLVSTLEPSIFGEIGWRFAWVPAPR